MVHKWFKWIMCVIVLGGVSECVAGGYGNYRSYHHQVQKVVVQETVIPLIDTLVVTPHNQFFKVYPDPQVSQIIKIERLVEPQNYLVQRLEYPVHDNVVVERQVVPYIQRERVYYNQYKVRNRCCY